MFRLVCCSTKQPLKLVSKQQTLTPSVYFCFPGCILAELYTGYPLFPGENEVEQLACIMEVLGIPPDDLINTATRRRLFFGKPRPFSSIVSTNKRYFFPSADSRGTPRCITNSKGRKRKPASKTLSQALRCNDTVFIDFVTRCLE